MPNKVGASEGVSRFEFMLGVYKGSGIYLEFVEMSSC